MSDAHSMEHFKSHIRGYVVVFVALMALTVVTVAASYLHLPTGMAITLALIIATVKASLVALYFMHLISEKKVIYLILLFAVLFIAGLPALTKLAYDDVPQIKPRKEQAK